MAEPHVTSLSIHQFCYLFAKREEKEKDTHHAYENIKRVCQLLNQCKYVFGQLYIERLFNNFIFCRSVDIHADTCCGKPQRFDAKTSKNGKQLKLTIICCGEADS